MWRSRMFWRLFATYGLLLLAAIVGLGGVVVNRVERHYQEQLEERFRTYSFLVREIIRRELYAGVGKRLFATDGPQIKLALAEAEAYDSGVVRVSYRAAA